MARCAVSRFFFCGTHRSRTRILSVFMGFYAIALEILSEIWYNKNTKILHKGTSDI